MSRMKPFAFDTDSGNIEANNDEYRTVRIN